MLSDPFFRLAFVFRTEIAVWSCSVKKVFSEISQNLMENTCARVFFLIKLQASHLHACSFIKKETLAQVFSREFYENSKNTEHLWVTASVSINSLILSGFPLTSFHLAEASLSAFPWFYTIVCAVVQKYHEMSFIDDYSHF